MKVDFYKHNISLDELKEVESVFQSTFLTTGPKTQKLEQSFSEYLGVPYCIGVNSCTAGLFLSLKALGIGEGDEVIVPAMTFIATSNVVIQAGAKPIFVDVEKDTGLIDAFCIEKAITPATKAIIPVHLYGQLADMEAIHRIAENNNLHVIEDAAHAIESRAKTYRTGTLGDIACFSFYATKNITCGDGGLISINNQALYEKLKVLRLHGMSKSAADRYTGPYKHWDMTEMGWKFNLGDIQSAILLPQLKKIDQRRDRREEICAVYENIFTQNSVDFPKVKLDQTSARHLFTVWPPRGKRDQALALLQEMGVGVAVNYRAVHLLTYYKEKFGYRPGDFPNAEEIGDRTISIPLYPRLTDEEVNYVAQSVVKVIKEL